MNFIFYSLTTANSAEHFFSVKRIYAKVINEVRILKHNFIETRKLSRAFAKNHFNEHCLFESPNIDKLHAG